MVEKKTEGVDEDFKERLEGFIKELKPILGKYELQLGALPEFTQDGRIIAQPVFVSSRKQPEPKKVEKPKEDNVGLSE